MFLLLRSSLARWNLKKSKSEGQRLLKEGAIYIDGESLGKVEKVEISKDLNVKVGKRRFLNIKVSK
jgi:tyrosyl-tRNA synthetase